MIEKKYLFAEKIFLLFPLALLFSNLVAEILLFIIIIIFLSDKKNSELIFKDKIFIFLIFFFVYLSINYLINFENNPSISRTFGFIRFPFFMISVAYMIKLNFVDIKKIITSWSFIFMIIFFDLFFQKFFGYNIFGYPIIMEGDTKRLGGFMNKELKIANLINHFLMLIIGYFFFIFIKEKRKKYSYIGLFLIIMTLLSVFFTAERSNFLTIVCASFIFILFRYGIYKFISSFLILFFIIFLFNFKYPVLVDRMILGLSENYTKIFKTDEKFFFKKDNIYFAHYSVAFQIFEANPIFGNGMNNFRKDCDNNKDMYSLNVHPNHRVKMCTTHPHSFYLEILSQLGIVGLLLLAIFFLLFLIRCFSVFFIKKENYLLLSGTIIILCYFLPIPRGSFFTNWNAIIFWLTFGVTYSQILFININK